MVSLRLRFSLFFMLPITAMKPLVEERAAVAARGELLAAVVRTRSDVPSWTAEVQQLLRSDCVRGVNLGVQG